MTTEREEKKRVSRSELSLKRINLERLQRQFENVISREAIHLLKLSYREKLNRDDAASACNYLKLLRDLKIEKRKEYEEMSEEELEKLLEKNGK